jgi:hypothetical protein
LAVYRDAVFQIGLIENVALKMDLVLCMMGTVDDSKERKLVAAL